MTTQLAAIHCSQCTATFQGEHADDFYSEFSGMLPFEAKENGWEIKGKAVCPDCIKSNHSHWRLPTSRELTSMLWSTPITNPSAFDDDVDVEDIGACDSFINESAQIHFHSIFAERATTWSSTKANTSLNGVMALRTDIGRTLPVSKGATLKVRLVRTHQADPSWAFGDAPELRYTISECGDYVTDNRTGYQWKRYLEPARYTWDEALETFKVPEQ